MRPRAKTWLVLVAVSLMLSAAVASGGAWATAPKTREYVVLYEKGATPAAARAAIVKARGRLVRENTAIGIATVRSRNPRFARVASATRAILSVGRARPIGTARTGERKKADPAERRHRRRGALPPDHDNRRSGGKGPEPLASLQWNMEMIHATRDGSYDRGRGHHKVLVGIIDTGIDGTHPDIAPNFDRTLSRNFTVDIPSIDGDCALEPDRSCADLADVDEDGHGTHVAGTVASPINGIGIAGVAPRVTLVNLRAGQDSGYFFLQPTLDAITYAADNGIDVVNMSFFTDPWLFNCRANPADSPAERAEQGLVIDAAQRAVDYARARGVTLIAALGNENLDMGLPEPIVDGFSPDFPAGAEKERVVDNSCLNVPAETDGVISVSSVGPSAAKSSFSNYGIEQTDVAAPGGWRYDFFGTPAFGSIQNEVLAPVPQSLLVVGKDIQPDGTPMTEDIVRDCRTGICAYYRYENGTSMAAPHAAGVAALIVSEFGSKRHGPGITMDPVEVERILTQTATKRPCPSPAAVDYTPLNDPFVAGNPTASCVGTPDLNGFYGHGIVDALAAVDGDHRHRRQRGHRDDREGDGD